MAARTTYWVLCTVAAILALPGRQGSGATALDFRGMEENCILSFVVPRDKVKSSCDMEERVTRRLNAMETKVALYREHMVDLQEQLQKERELNSHTIGQLHETVRQSRTLDAEGVLQKRIQALEEEVRRLRLISSSTPSVPTQRSSPPSGLEDKIIGLVATEHIKEEEERVLVNVVKPLVQAEVKKLFDNYTQYIARYMRDQALAVSQIITMAPRSEHSQMSSRHLSPTLKENGNITDNTTTATNTTTPSASLTVETQPVLQESLESSPSKFNESGVQVTFQAEQDASTAPDTSIALAADADHSSMDINYIASGESNETVLEKNATLSFTLTGSDTTSLDDTTRTNVYVPAIADVSKEASSAAKARMSHSAGSEVGKAQDHELVKDISHTNSTEMGGNQAVWSESMIHDQSPGEQLQEMMRTEIQRVFKEQAEEILNLVTKHSAAVNSRLEDQENRFGQLERRLTADVKLHDQIITAMKMELTSAAQGVQTLFARSEKMGELDTKVEELKKNISVDSNSRFLASTLDEQGKKVRKLERLTVVYQQSLEHYRNDTKLEYRDLKERITKETGVVRSLTQEFYHNLTSESRQMVSHLNTSINRQIEDVKQRMQVIEDSSLLINIDLASFERQLKSKTSKSERGLEQTEQEVKELKQQSRALQKDVEEVKTSLERMHPLMNATSAEVSQLKMEVQLNVLGEWLPYNFDYKKTRTDCFGDQYVKKSGFKTGRLVGVVLCTKDRYKIFLANALTETFKNIGDESGIGEDHCQFVDAKNTTKVKVSPFRASTETESGYVRTHWGQEPRPELLNIIRPSPVWYECGVSIPVP